MTILRPLLAPLLPPLHGPFAQDGTGAAGEAAGGGVLWNPTMISGCKVWLRADKGVTLNGSNVSSWADQSGNGHNAVQATAAKQPAYSASGLNSRPGITFDGSDDCLRIPVMSYGGVDKVTVALLAKDTATALSVIMEGHTGAAANYFSISANNLAAGRLYARSHDTAGNNSGFTVEDLTSARRVIVQIDRTISGGAIEVAMYVDENLQTLTQGTTVDTTGNFNDTLALNIGARNDGLNSGWAGTLGEVAVWNRLLGAAEIAQLSAYMRSQWGLA